MPEREDIPTMGLTDYIAIGWWGLLGVAFTLTETVPARIKRNKNARLRRKDMGQGKRAVG